MKLFRNESGSPSIENIVWIALFVAVMLTVLIYFMRGVGNTAVQTGNKMEQRDNDEFCGLSGKTWNVAAGYDSAGTPICH